MLLLPCPFAVMRIEPLSPSFDVADVEAEVAGARRARSRRARPRSSRRHPRAAEAQRRVLVHLDERAPPASLSSAPPSAVRAASPSKYFVPTRRAAPRALTLLPLDGAIGLRELGDRARLLLAAERRTTAAGRPRRARRRRASMLLLEIDVLDRDTVGIDRDVELLVLETSLGDFDLVLTRREVDRERAVGGRRRLRIARRHRDGRARRPACHPAASARHRAADPAAAPARA